MLNIIPFIPLFLTFILVLLGLLPGFATRHHWRTISLVTLACSIADAILLIALPLLGLSFGKITFPLPGLNSIRLAMLITSLLIFSFFKARQKLAHVVTTTLITAQLLFLALAFYGLYIEPFHLTVTEVRQEAPAFFPDRPLRIVQLSDLHIERITTWERGMIQKVSALQPDIIVLTGDYINQEYLADPVAMDDARSLLSQLNAPYGVYAISGSTDNYALSTALFDGLDNIRLLWNEITPVSLPGGMLNLVGLSMNGDSNLDRQMLLDLLTEYPADGYNVLLYHTPDLIETAAEHSISLYFAGHTHGGQVRLPFYGAIITFSDYGKKYEMGKYQVGPTTLYVSRGLGMEGLGLPRIRFLCPPEIIFFELGQ